MRIITISGYAGAGKSTFCESLEQHLAQRGYSVRTIAFGDKAKAMFSELKYMPMDKVFGDVNAKNRHRGDLVVFSETIKEMFGKEVWAKPVVDSIQQHPDFDITIIPDMRFREEYCLLKETFGEKISPVTVIRDEVAPKATEEWYREGRQKGILTRDQTYQFFNLVNPNPMATHTQGVHVHNDDSLESLRGIAGEFLDRMNLKNKKTEKKNVQRVK